MNLKATLTASHRYFFPHQQSFAEEVKATLHIVRDWVREAFTSVDKYHGVDHAFNVEKNVVLICRQKDIQVSQIEQLLLCVAALLHDVGYASYSPNWVQDRREHVKFGLDFTFNRLPKLPFFSANPTVILVTCYLIAHHDDINYQYPSMAWGGKVQAVDLGPYAEKLRAFEELLSSEEKEHLQFLLSILTAADALAATSKEGVERTFNYSIERNLPIFAQGNPLNAWSWEESAVGNVRLAAKRALIAAPNSTVASWAEKGYEAMERFIEALCHRHHILYCRETLSSIKSGSEWSKYFHDPGLNFRLLSYCDWLSLEMKLRKVPLLGDKNLLPYMNAHITVRRCNINELRPTSRYVLRSQIEQHNKVQTNLLSQYRLSLFDLLGMIEYLQNDDKFNLIPAIIETYYEAAEKAVVSVIVDGLHRVWLARQLGLKEIWLIEISEIPDDFPLVPLPLSWEDVKLVDVVPPTHEKRKFRFPSFESFPNVSKLTQVPITSDNYLYFFYRDLSLFGSSGIRSSSDNIKK